jgi:phospholipid/cholesterol/gamma-HCH transport system substrate-binding protein
MRDKLGGVALRLGIFVLGCLLALFANLMIFAQLRFGENVSYQAEFTNVSGLKRGDFVRIGGVEVGKVNKIWLNPDATVVAQFSTDQSVVLTTATRAAIRYQNLIGDRYLALMEGDHAATRIQPGKTIPVQRTQPALDLDALIGGFRPLFRALDPDQVNALAGQLIQAFQDQGATFSSFFAGAGDLFNTLADRGQLIDQLVTNLDAVLGSLGDHSKQFDKAVTSLSDLIRALTDRKADISNAVGAGNAAAKTVANLLEQARPPLQKVVGETDRTSGLVVADRDYVDRLLTTWPDAYQALARLGVNGGFFSFYLCDVLLKFNGKGGQPVYAKVASQPSGRCTPK